MKRAVIFRQLLPATLVWVVFLVAGWRGLEFGYHWDEDALVAKVKWSVAEGGILLPPTYDWPGGTYWVAAAALAPSLAGFANTGPRVVSALDSYLQGELDSPHYRHRLRLFFLLLASLAVFGVAAATLFAGGSAWDAALAAGFFAGSWEVAYHSRFAAPDGLLLPLVTGALASFVYAARYAGARALGSAALFVGLAIGTKYQVAVLLIPFVALVYHRSPLLTAREQRRTLWLVIAGFLIATPGALFMPVRFADGVLSVFFHYGVDGHGAHTVAPGAGHLVKLLEYVGVVLMSPYPWLAVWLGAAAVTGVWFLRRDRGMLISLLAFPVVLLVMLALHRVMIVRNVLPVTPFLAVLGGVAVSQLSRAGGARTALAVRLAATLLVAINLAFVAIAGVRIARGHDVAGDTQRWLAGHAATPLKLSASVRPLAPAAAESSTPSVYVMFLSDQVCGRSLPANVRGLTELVAGWQEVNLDYYPDWAGRPHVVAVDIARLQRAVGCAP